MADIYYSHPSCNVCPFFPTSNLQTDVNGSVEAYFEKMCMLRLSEYGKLNQLACNEVSSELFCPPPPPPPPKRHITAPTVNAPESSLNSKYLI